MHYIFTGININKYQDKINLISHFDERTDNRIHVYLSHGAGEKSKNNPLPLNCDYYLCWNKAEYNNITARGKKAYLVGSVYNELTKPLIANRNSLVYIPQHVHADYINRVMYANNGVPDNILIPKLNKPYLTQEQLITFREIYKCDDVLTSIVEDTDPNELVGQNLICSDRNTMNHIDKCKKLYSEAKMCIIDDMGTFDLVGVNHGVPITYRDALPDDYQEQIDMPMDNNLELIHKALDEIYERN